MHAGSSGDYKAIMTTKCSSDCYSAEPLWLVTSEIASAGFTHNDKTFFFVLLRMIAVLNAFLFMSFFLFLRALICFKNKFYNLFFFFLTTAHQIRIIFFTQFFLHS